MRLLGKSVQTVGKQPANPQTLTEAARLAKQTLSDKSYLNECIQNGIERVGNPGGSAQIADRLAALLWNNPAKS
jgi:hypothetical protein